MRRGEREKERGEEGEIGGKERRRIRKGGEERKGERGRWTERRREREEVGGREEKRKYRGGEERRERIRGGRKRKARMLLSSIMSAPSSLVSSDFLIYGRLPLMSAVKAQSCLSD